MTDIELQDIWKAYNKKIEESRILNLQSWALNRQCFESIQTHKAQQKLNALAKFKVGAIVLGILYVLFLGVLIYGNQLNNLYFTASIGMIMLITLISIAVYIRHIVLIQQINYSETILGAQKKLATLQSSTINIVRIAFLQMPFYSTFFWSKEWIVFSSIKTWLIPIPVTLFFVLLTVWLYRNISLHNANKRWFKILMGTPEWTSITQAMQFMNEIEEFKKDMV
jgi:hypothetical protein